MAWVICSETARLSAVAAGLKRATSAACSRQRTSQPDAAAQALFGRACVATITGNRGVCTAQYKTGLRVVIELP